MTDQTFSGELERGLKEFQRDFGLKEDGVAGLVTLQALKDALSVVTPGSFRPEANTRSEIAKLQREIHARVTELSRLVSNSLGLDSTIPVREFTLHQQSRGPS